MPIRRTAKGFLWAAIFAAVLGLGCATASSQEALTTAGASYGTPPGWTLPSEQYGVTTQANVTITMDDGVTLNAIIYEPTDPATGNPASGPFPVIVTEAPYGAASGLVLGQLDTLLHSLPAGLDPVGGGNEDPLGLLADADGWGSWLVKRGYIDVVVDVRGTGLSGGMHQLFGTREQQDSVNVVKWAAALPHSNGNVGMISESYEAVDQIFAAQALGPNSPLKAIFPIFPGNSAFRELINNDGMYDIETLGIMNGQILVPDLDLVTSLLTGHTNIPYLLSRLSTNSYNLFQQDGILEMAVNVFTNGDDSYDGTFWHSGRTVRDALNAVVANGVAVYVVGGQRDVFQAGDLLTYSGLQNASVNRPVGAPMLPSQSVSGRFQELWGPFYHLTEGYTPQFNLQPNLHNIQIAWFDRWLKGVNNGIDQTKTPLHLLDQNLGIIETMHYPLTETTPVTYYLTSNGALSTSKPGLLSLYASDTMPYTGFENPCNQDTVQFIAGLSSLFTYWLNLGNPCGQQVNPTPWLLSYTSAPFTTETVLAGQVGATLYASTTSTDIALLAHLDDVAPDGSSLEISSGSVEGTFQAIDTANSWTTPNGEYAMPYHALTRASLQNVTPLLPARYDIAVRSSVWTLEPGHRLRLRVSSGDVPHLIPPPWNLPKLFGLYSIQRNPAYASRVTVPLASATAFAAH